MSLVLQAFGQKSKYQTNYNFDLTMVQNVKLGKLQSHYNSSWRDENVLTKFNSNPSNSCGDITLEITNVNLMVALQVKSGVTKNMSIHPLSATDIFIKISRHAIQQVLRYLGLGPATLQTLAKDEDQCNSVEGMNLWNSCHEDQIYLAWFPFQHRLFIARV